MRPVLTIICSMISDLPPPDYEIRVVDGDGRLRRSFEVGGGKYAFVFHLTGSLRISSPEANFPEPLNRPAIVRASSGTQMNWSEGSKFCGVMILMSVEFLARELDSYRPGLRPEVRSSIFDACPCTVEDSLTPDDRNWIEAIGRPPVSGAAATLWYKGKMQELMALQVFPKGKPDAEFFCSKQRRLAGERVRKVKKFLSLHLDEPLNLKALAQKVGCSAHYLCRTFSNETGITISRYLRAIRIDQASKLLLSGKYNVTEAAIEVGYQSMSHFSKAFQQEKGRPPSRYVDAA